MTTPTLFLTLGFRDADAGMDFLRKIGFEEVAVYRDPDDERTVFHAEFRWRTTGGLMLGSARDDNNNLAPVGTTACYLVVDSDAQVDAVYEKALAAGGVAVLPPAEKDYGGRGATVSDAEGNTYSFGSYRGSTQDS